MDLKTAIKQLDLTKVDFFGTEKFEAGVRCYSCFNDSDYFLELKKKCENPLCLKIFTDKSPFGSSWGSIFTLIIFVSNFLL